MNELTFEKAINLLINYNISKPVFEHCLMVSEIAEDIANKIMNNGHYVDVDLVRVGGLIHDIGRSKTHDIMHGLEGANLLKDYPKLQRICKTHIGAGIPKAEAIELGLGDEDYLPKTIEEKIISYTDKIVDGEKVISFDQALEKYRSRLGTDHPAIERMSKLHEEITKLMS